MVVALLVAGCTSDGFGTTTSATTVAPATTTTSTTSTTTTTTTLPTTTTTTPPVDDGYPWAVGDCFDFGPLDDVDLLPYAPYGDRHLVACAGEHTHEVYYAAGLEEGPDEPYPGPELGERVSETCATGFAEYVGLLRPESVLEVVLYLPDAEEWTAGERYVTCVLYRPGPVSTLADLEESMEGAAGRVAWPAEPGTCYSATYASPRYAEPLDCESPHAYEVVGTVIHPAGPDEPFPDPADLAGFIDQACTEALVGYADDALARDVSSGVLPFEATEWDLGQRSAPCLAFALDDAGRLLEVEGSFSGRWREVGVIDDTFTT